MSKADGRTCSNCHWSRPPAATNKDQDTLGCSRYPPTVMRDAKGAQSSAVPRVPPTWSCGEWTKERPVEGAKPPMIRAMELDGE